MHVLQHLSPLSRILSSRYHSELALKVSVKISIAIPPHLMKLVLGHVYLIWTIFDVNCIDGLHEVIVDFQGLLVSTELLEKTSSVITKEQGSKKPEAPEELGGKI